MKMFSVSCLRNNELLVISPFFFLCFRLPATVEWRTSSTLREKVCQILPFLFTLSFRLLRHSKVCASLWKQLGNFLIEGTGLLTSEQTAPWLARKLCQFRVLVARASLLAISRLFSPLSWPGPSCHLLEYWFAILVRFGRFPLTDQKCSFEMMKPTMEQCALLKIEENNSFRNVDK